MNSSRDSAGSMRPYATVRPATIGSPYTVTRSVATTAARFGSHRGSLYVRRTRCSASGSTHSGSMRATSRPHSREVSTSSAAITQGGCLRASDEPGKIPNRALRAPT